VRRSIPIRILVVDDEALIRLLIVESLEERGFDILEAASGIDALCLIAGTDAIDLLVTDVNMPDPDGIAVARQIRVYHPNIPVVFVSGRADLLGSLALPPPHHVIAKPFRLEALCDVVEQMLRLRAARPAGGAR
jgi:CheY-like chemotaxis protein